VPGGAIEPGEVPAEAAAREAFEETGLVLAITGLRCALGGPEFRTVYANGDVLSYVALVYDAAVTGGEEHPDGDEIAEVGWFTRAELAELPQEQFVQLLLRDGIIA
jgi:ADP-ribose pyrophosphatase YjhB (NUDIX family)